MKLFNEVGEVRQSPQREIGRNTKAFDNSKSDVKAPRHIPTINEKYEGRKYPGTNVEYRKHTFRLNGEKVEGVFPVFESKFNTYITKNYWNKTRASHEAICNKKLVTALENNPGLERNFTPRQLSIIKNSRSIAGTGLTWHHTEIPGKMQLVDTRIHTTCRHTGGYSIWGGGASR